MDKKGTAAPVNINTAINLFLDTDTSQDKSPIKIGNILDTVHNSPDALNNPLEASAPDMVSNSDADNGGDISEPGEVEEKNKAKEGDNYSIAGGAKDTSAPPTATLSDPTKTPQGWEDA
jgi:hypothetical protein